MTRRHSYYATFLILGASILLARTIILMSEGALVRLTLWAAVLLVIEAAMNVAWLAAAVRWAVTRIDSHLRFTLRVAGAAIVFHGFRVLIFVLGRTGPWIDFDVRPDYRSTHAETWSWSGVYIASILSSLGIIGVIAFWQYRKRIKRKSSA